MTGPLFDGIYEFFRRQLLLGGSRHERRPPVRQRSRAVRRGSATATSCPFREATRTWFAISLQTFGGPAGQIAVMQRTLVDEKRWIGQRRFLHALSYCTLLPGPEAQQLAIYIGWLLNGVRGGLVAGILFVLPGVVALLALSRALRRLRRHHRRSPRSSPGSRRRCSPSSPRPWCRVGGRALGHPALVALAVAAFVALAVFARAVPGRHRRRGGRRLGAGPLGAADHASARRRTAARTTGRRR